jgi:FkbM family methyltransferase
MLRQLFSRFQRLREHPIYRQNRFLILWRAGLWSLHCLFGVPARAKFARWNFRLYLPAKWRGGGCTSPYVFREHYEPELMLLERFLQPGMVFVDGGANTGVFTFVAARLVGPLGQVLSFEPGAGCFQALRRSLELNQLKNICLNNSALSDHTGTARLYHLLGQENAFSLAAAENVDFDEVPIATLDDVVRMHQLTHVDFIKLDVEGAEELVLRGAREVLDRWQPVVLFEVNIDATHGMKLSPDGACRLLTESGYQLYALAENGELTETNRLPQQVGNLLALPAKLSTTPLAKSLDAELVRSNGS